MSACLFTISPESLKDLSDDEVKARIRVWAGIIGETLKTPSWDQNRFLFDRLHGFKDNLMLAEVELYERSLKEAT